MTPPSILILGVGELGEAIVRHLAQHPQRNNCRISVLKRKPAAANSKSIDLEALGVETILGDVVNDSESHLSTIFSKFHTVISCNGMFLPPDIQVKVAKVALRSGIRRYFPWQFGVDYDVIGPNSSQNLFTTQLEVRAMLRAQSEMEWVIVSTGMFTSFLFEPSFGLVDDQREVVTAIGSWDDAITVTSPDDIGRITAEIALVCLDIQGVVYTAGDTVTMARLADIVERVSGEEVKRALKTVPQLKEELAADPENGMLKYQIVFGEGIGVSWDKSSTFNAARGIETETADEWAQKNLR